MKDLIIQIKTLKQYNIDLIFERVMEHNIKSDNDIAVLFRCLFENQFVTQVFEHVSYTPPNEITVVLNIPSVTTDVVTSVWTHLYQFFPYIQENKNIQQMHRISPEPYTFTYEELLKVLDKSSILRYNYIK